MYTQDNISVYIFNWKKVSHNTVELLNNIKKYNSDITVINCDELFKFEHSIKTIQLDDSHYYGSQYEHAVRDVKENKIICIIVGDNISENNFEKIFKHAIDAFNKYKVGVFAPNDKRSTHQKRNECLAGNIYHVNNTDCGFWFINPEIVKKTKNIDFGKLSPLGWGIDNLIIKESLRLGFVVIRDYNIETDQLDKTTNYNSKEASKGKRKLLSEYEKIINSNT